MNIKKIDVVLKKSWPIALQAQACDFKRSLLWVRFPLDDTLLIHFKLCRKENSIYTHLKE